jgi:two-component system, OmpR family, phosphate regulon response regulator PhoB
VSDLNRRRRVLILEDDEAIALMMAFYFEEENYEVHSARHCQGFVDLAARLKPDLICLDICLPESDGISVCSDLKSDARTRTIPVTFVSVRDPDPDDPMSGAEAYIVKPFTERELKSVARRLIAGERVS